jgi:hypothetical protein
MAQNDGGPAFPATEYPMRVGTYDEEGSAIVRVSSPGMSLRDWFAGQALAGIMSNCTGDGRTTWLPESAAFHAYSVAEAMLKAREQ